MDGDIVGHTGGGTSSDIDSDIVEHTGGDTGGW